MKINEIITEAVKQRLDPKCRKGKHKEGTKIKGEVRVNNCVPNEGVVEGQGEQISKTKALNSLRKELMNSYEYMKCANLEEFKQRLQWLSEGMLKNHMTNGKSTVINREEIKIYQEYRKKREQIQRGLTQGVAEGAENLSYIGNCTDDDVIEYIFGDATGFAQAVDEYGDEFTLDDLVVKYDPETDVHSFYYKAQGVAEANGGHAGSTKVRYTSGMHGTYEPTKHQSSPQAHLDAAKYHDNEANTYITAMNSPKALPKDTEWYKGEIHHHKNKADFHRQSSAEQGVAEDWNKVNHHDKTDGLSQKAVNAYRREHPGSKLKTAVTTKPSKLKAGSKDAKRRKSFCARMSGNKGPMKDKHGKPTPKAKALRRWNC